jgi:hypothetical protein
LFFALIFTFKIDKIDKKSSILSILKSKNQFKKQVETFTNTINPIFLVLRYPSDYSMIFVEFDQSDLIFRGGGEGYKFTGEYM